MPAVSVPTSPGADFHHFMEKSRLLEGENLTTAIPRALFTPRTSRGLLGFGVSLSLYAVSIAGIVLAPHWYLYPPLWVLAGLGGWGLHCIAHDCGHGSFSRSRRLNTYVGHIALLPLLYPYQSWRHVHNMHHAHTNNLELDTDWRPVPAQVYARMQWWERAVYSATRTWAFWGGSIRYWLVSGFRPGFFPKASTAREVRRSIAFTAPAGLLLVAGLFVLAGWQGFVVCFLVPWLAIHLWFSATTLMHHSASDLPFLTSEHWTRNAGRLLLTTDFVYPRFLNFLTHNIAVHTAHHVAPAVPFYNLPQAQAALRHAYPGVVREERLRPLSLWRILRDLHLYDARNGFYQTFSGAPVPPEGSGS
ncbi:fatty acid desaturase [Micromonospora inyonensis]|uniref:Omega-6 fatty acid desaturase (Delta-12 desaturase) n=1 Tax=Micromonospora inyonensis TaxID=47866 RepID=A0A1C6S638_9ACTN|nr:fatty acid desaturase [Micromonospora inyonensis]SCL24952.1 omega-6 fatty acid desaturase (delta-12 desaturase) [Micromonospora inyonensis]